MRTITALILLLIGIVSTSNSQWVSNYGAFSHGDVNLANAKGNAVTVDHQGYSYVTGYVTGLLNDNDIVIIKYTPTGDTAWTRAYDGSLHANDEGTGICVDANGNVYVVGSSQNSGRSYDVVVLKYSSEGTLLWDKPYYEVLAAKIDKGLAITVDDGGSAYVTGYTTGADGLQNIVTLKYNSAGALVWQSLEDGPTDKNSQGLCIAVSASGNVYVGGYTTSATSSSNTEIAVVMYNALGQKVWLKEIQGGGNSEDKAWGIAVDQLDNIYITGYQTVSYNNTDCYTAKLNSYGDIIWDKAYDGGGNQTDKAWGIVIDTDGAIYITGQAANASYNTNYVTIKYNNSGSQAWIKTYNGTGNGEDIACAVGVMVNLNNTKSVVVTGKSWGSLNYDYATVKYDSESGLQTGASRYSMNGLTNDVAKDIAVSDELHKVYVTGYSQLILETTYENSVISTMMIQWEKNSDLTAENTVPNKFVLHQNYPNPFNPSTTIKFDISSASSVKLAVYDMLGRVVDVLVNQDLNAGSYSINYTNKGLASGIYFYELTAGDMKEIKKMTLVK